ISKGAQAHYADDKNRSMGHKTWLYFIISRGSNWPWGNMEIPLYDRNEWWWRLFLNVYWLHPYYWPSAFNCRIHYWQRSTKRSSECLQNTRSKQWFVHHRTMGRGRRIYPDVLLQCCRRMCINLFPALYSGINCSRNCRLRTIICEYHWESTHHHHRFSVIYHD